MFIGVPIGSFIGTPSFKERLDYLDMMTVYRQVVSPGITPNVLGWTIASASESNGTLLRDIACCFHSTPNADSTFSGGLLDKVQNTETLNLITCQPAIDLNSAYLVYITSRIAAGGRSFWVKVNGEAENETLVPCTCVYISPYLDPVEIV